MQWKVSEPFARVPSLRKCWFSLSRSEISGRYDVDLDYFIFIFIFYLNVLYLFFVFILLITLSEVKLE